MITGNPYKRFLEILLEYEMTHRKFVDSSSQIYQKRETCNSYPAYSYSGIPEDGQSNET